MSGGMNRVIAAKRASLLVGAFVAVTAVVPGPWSLAAQEMVQALPPREAAQLNAALRRLATRPSDIEALVSAGNASLVLRDTGAASGFFTRAANIAPADRRVLVGLARVALEQRRPVAALQHFTQAENAGVRPREMAADRALAYDLVGDNAAAQVLYRSALTAGEDTELRRRLALSLAISGNRSEFEKVLYPLLRDEDRAAYRTRAFGLAVLGRPDEAVAIADAMMSTDLALRMAPYLRYMPRLTKAQQAAAANLGAFPAAAEIGRDSAEIAGYATAGARIAANASASLTPVGAPLGRRVQPKSAAVSAPASSLARRGPVTIPTSVRAPSLPVVRVASAPLPTPTPAPAPARRPVVVARSSPPPPIAAAGERQSLAEAFADLGQAPGGTVANSVGAVDIANLVPVRRATSEAPAKPGAAAKAVKPAAKPKVEKRPVEPARIWVQIGVGRNTSAFGFDWRRLAKEAGGALDGKGPWAAKYGATNRMLAGPYSTDAAAKAAIKRLKAKGIEALPFTSDEGEKVIKIG